MENEKGLQMVVWLRRMGGVAVVALVAACSSTTTPPPRPAQSSTSAEAVPPTSAVKAAPAKPAGLIFANVSDQNCTIKSLDPSTGKVATIVTFDYHRIYNVQQFACFNINPRGVSAAPTIFPTTFDRIAVTQNPLPGPEQAGWVDPTGSFTPIGPASSHPEYGPPTRVSAFGFDKHDNFYYQVSHNPSDPAVNDGYSEYFRVAAGSTGNGQSVGRVKAGDKDTFGLLADGTLAVGAPEIPNCHLGVAGIEPWDPSITSFYEMARDNRLYKTNGPCVADSNGGEVGGNTPFSGGTPLTPPHWNVSVGPFAVSPDRSKVAIQSQMDDRIFFVDTSEPNVPKPMSVPELPVVGSDSTFRLIRWQ